MRPAARGSGFKGSIRGNADSGFCTGGGAGSGFKGLIREKADSGFCAAGIVGSGFTGLIRGNADSRFCAAGRAGSGFKGLIRGNVDLGLCAGAAACASAWLAHARDPALRAATVVCDGLAARRCGGVAPRIAPGAMLLEEKDMRAGSGWK